MLTCLRRFASSRLSCTHSVLPFSVFHLNFVRIASWQSGLSNGAVVGEMIGLVINGWAQDRFGCRPTYLVALVWMIIAIFVPVFANSLPALVAGEILCGESIALGLDAIRLISDSFAGTAWGVFQILSTAYASEVVPTCLRPFVTAWVCCCWGIGILISFVNPLSRLVLTSSFVANTLDRLDLASHAPSLTSTRSSTSDGNFPLYCNGFGLFR